jgi:hypothetical protein
MLAGGTAHYIPTTRPIQIPFFEADFSITKHRYSRFIDRIKERKYSFLVLCVWQGFLLVLQLIFLID